MRPTTTSHGFEPTLENERRYEAPVLIEIGGVLELTLWGGGGGDDGDDGGGHHTWPCWHGKTIGRSDGFTWIIPTASC
jgi:hypothetical protein